MPSSKCIGRTAAWRLKGPGKTVGEIGPRSRYTVVGICKQLVSEDCILCEECKRRYLRQEESETFNKEQATRFHGLLTDPPPYESRVWGGPQYWERRDKLEAAGALGEDPAWLDVARAAQAEAEAWCRAAGYEPWTVQRPTEEELKEMKASSAAGRPKRQVPEVKGQLSLKKFIPVIHTLYEESQQEPEKIASDTMKVEKRVVEGCCEAEMLVAANGMVFALDETGAATVLKGRVVDGVFVARPLTSV